MRTTCTALMATTLIFVFCMSSNGPALAVTSTVSDTLTSPIGAPLRLFQEQYKRSVAQEFKVQLQNTTDPVKRDTLKASQASKSMELELTYTEFMGTSHYDNSILSGEFLHHQGDAMMKKRNAEGESFFFFNASTLWKVVQTLPATTDAQELSRLLTARYGAAVTIQNMNGVEESTWRTTDAVIALSDRRNEYGCYTLTHAMASLTEARRAMTPKADNVAKLDPMIQAILSGGNDDSVSNVVDGILDEASAGTH